MSNSREVRKLFESAHNNELAIFKTFTRKNVWGHEIIEFAYQVDDFNKTSQKFKTTATKLEAEMNNDDCWDLPTYKLIALETKMEKLEKTEGIKRYTLDEMKSYIKQQEELL